MTIALFIQREDSIRSRRRAPPGEPLLMFGEPGVLAKAEARGAAAIGLVLRRVLDKTGRWVSRWCRPAQGGDLWPELHPGSKAWLDKLNAEYGPLARPTADEMVNIIRLPKDKFTAKILQRGLDDLANARFDKKMPDIDKMHLLSFWLPLYTRGQVELHMKPELTREGRELAVGAASMSGISAMRPGALTAGGMDGLGGMGGLNPLGSRSLNLEIGHALAPRQVHAEAEVLPNVPAVTARGKGGLKPPIVLFRTGAANDEPLTGTRLARRTGIDGERAVGISNRKEKLSIPGTNRSRVPDSFLDGVLVEVKNVLKQSCTLQLRDFVTYCRKNNCEFHLYVRNSTRLSSGLLKAQARGDIKIFHIPGSK